MDCLNCTNESRIKILEENCSKVVEKVEEHGRSFEELRTNNAVREERDKSIANSLSFIQANIAELTKAFEEYKSKPVKRFENIADSILTKAVLFILGGFGAYLIYLAK